MMIDLDTWLNDPDARAALPRLTVCDGDDDTWTVVPQLWRHEWDDIGEWAHELADIIWIGFDPQPGDIEDYAERMQATVEYTVERHPMANVLIYSPDPHIPPLPVTMLLLPSTTPDRTTALRELTLADDPDAVRPAVADPVTTDHLGEGLRVTRAIPGDEDGLFYQLRYAWRSELHGVDILVAFIAYDAYLMTTIAPDLDEYVHTLRVLAPWEYEPDEAP